VPTWNYEVVHVHGRIRWRDEPDWLLAHVADLTERFEADQPSPWAVTDAPAEHVQRLVGAIVGVEIAIERIEAKSKLSQNRSPADREGVIRGLANGPEQGRALANLMKKLGF
jgi:transcriptional regulator